jgi:hypothetical protein
MSKYRVDRALDSNTPCGMNSVLYLGNSEYHARKVFLASAPGKDPWNQDNPEYGVLLSMWNSVARDYVPVKFKSI